MRFDPSNLAYDSNGLIPAIAQDETTGEVLMMAWMNRETVETSLREGRSVYWSRSRGEVWRKGETSGNVQELVEMRVDCDRDCLLLIVRQTGPACHTGRRSCFYTAIRAGEEAEVGGVHDEHFG
jgi:phosphoribosyl-AMP cyclohydrolase